MEDSTHQKKPNFIIVIDDEEIMSPLLESTLQTKSLAFQTSEDFYKNDTKEAPIAIFLDVHLGINDNGIDMIPAIRARWAYCPIIVMSGDIDAMLIGQALAAGANDFIKKPFDVKELTARLRIRSAELKEREANDNVMFHDVQLNTGLSEVVGPKGSSYLSQIDCRLLHYLILANGTLVSRAELKRKLWGNVNVTDNALDKRMHEVRKALRFISSQVAVQSSYRQGFSLVIESVAQKQSS
jgi:DNA-binding response OmpR family regulator